MVNLTATIGETIFKGTANIVAAPCSKKWNAKIGCFQLISLFPKVGILLVSPLYMGVASVYRQVKLISEGAEFAAKEAAYFKAEAGQSDNEYLAPHEYDYPKPDSHPTEYWV